MKDLEQLLEDENSGFVQTIYDIFGNALWNAEIWHPSVEDIKTCFKILNKYVFDRKLVMPDIRVEKFDRTKHVNADGDFFIGRFHVGVVRWKDGLPEFEMYILILDCGRSDFFNIFNILCHEMIHLYDYMYGNREAILKDIIGKGTDKNYVPQYDTHGKFFEDEAKRINGEFGLDITKSEAFSVLSRYKGDKPMEKSDDTFNRPEDLLEESDETLLSAGYDPRMIDLARRLSKAFKGDSGTEITLEKDGTVSIDTY